MILFGVYHLIYEIQIEKLQISFQAYIFFHLIPTTFNLMQTLQINHELFGYTPIAVSNPTISNHKHF